MKIQKPNITSVFYIIIIILILANIIFLVSHFVGWILHERAENVRCGQIDISIYDEATIDNCKQAGCKKLEAEGRPPRCVSINNRTIPGP